MSIVNKIKLMPLEAFTNLSMVNGFNNVNGQDYQTYVCCRFLEELNGYEYAGQLLDKLGVENYKMDRNGLLAYVEKAFGEGIQCEIMRAEDPIEILRKHQVPFGSLYDDCDSDDCDSDEYD